MLKELISNIWEFGKSGGGTHEQKYHNIRRIFKTFPSMKFILIGDNGQSDPEIYSRIAEEFSDRIIVIYIRTIRKRKTKKTQEITGQLKRKGIDMLSLKDSHEASIDAIKRGLISPYSEPSIRVERDAEQ
jgi:phosphatidate phosphatase APP1